MLSRYIDALTGIFRRCRDKHEAQAVGRTVLGDMSAEPGLLKAVLAHHLTKKGALDIRHYPVLSINLDLNPYFGLDANCWIPHPSRSTRISTKSIHHHGNMLLSTATVFGPGYEHWTFHPPEVIDPAQGLFRLRLIERVPHPVGHVAFVDRQIAHLPMYPPSLSITLALWSNCFPTTWRDRLKRIGFLKRNEELLRRLAAATGLVRALDLKIVEYYDYYPTVGGFQGMKERCEFPRTCNEDYLYSLFHVLQETRNADLAGLIDRQPAANRPLIEQLRASAGSRSKAGFHPATDAHANFTRKASWRHGGAGHHPALRSGKPQA